MSGRPEEVWKPIPSAPGYEASRLGRIRCWRPRNRQASAPAAPRIVKATRDSHGYYGVSISIDGHASRRKVHALVLEAFKGPRPPGLQARHIMERDQSNNTPDNLEWGTAKQNQADRRRHAMQQLQRSA